MRLRCSALFLTLAAFFLMMAACGDSTATTQGRLKGEIPIGAVWSTSGAAGIYGPPQDQGAQLAVQEINASGMLGNASLKLHTIPYDSTDEGSRAAFNTLINDTKVPAILGPTLSTTALPTNPIAQQAGVVVLGVSNTATGITEMGDYIFRNSLPESVVQPHMVHEVVSSRGIRTAAIFYTTGDAFSVGSYQVFKTALAVEGVVIAATYVVHDGDKEFSQQLSALSGSNLDAIVITSLANEAARIMEQARAMDRLKGVRFLGGNNFDSDRMIGLAGQAMEGAISGTAWNINAGTPGNAAFAEAYRNSYGADPDQFSAQAYTGVYLLAQAIKIASSEDPTEIRDALLQIQDMDTVLGSFSFTEAREPEYDPVVQVVRDGAFEVFGQD